MDHMPGPVTRDVKKYLLRLIAGVVALDAIMIGLYYGLSVPLRPERTQQTFVAAWVVVTLIIVTTMLKKIRRARTPRA
jgi:putative Mn2+ efflux pump MntP